MSEAKYLLVAAAVVLALVAVSLLRRARRGGGPMVVQTRGLPHMRGSLDAGAGRRVSVALGRDILQLLETGRRAEAVARVREATGWGAAEAEEAVAKLEKLMERLGS